MPNVTLISWNGCDKGMREAYTIKILIWKKVKRILRPDLTWEDNIRIFYTNTKYEYNTHCTVLAVYSTFSSVEINYTAQQSKEFLEHPPSAIS